ncbi:MAG: carbamoyl-phosphate synthase large subunit [Firmicutes bacterium]|uniref:Multifunctional fusion protein n=1 Tax=Candidatus Stercoripulliclostridium pullicola TaxID=2840953 RepID=A0A940ICY4_9FIRM|nr:carbamoyl-phosphate synthase large subunit [Candidatus Stercoripulliclostridium pullicola]
MPLDKRIKKVLVIGSGPIVIGQAAEFDYAGTQACRVLKAAGIEVVLVNSNPATIMTDKALADEIYLEPLTLETVKRIIVKEKPDSILGTLGGQTGLTLSMQLEKEGFLKAHNCRLIGTNAEAICKAEDRELFKETMQSIGQPCIPSDIANELSEALAVAKRIGYPVIIRPAFTLGGNGGGVAYNEEELRSVAATGLDVSPIHQVLVERYIYGWKEIEFETMRDAIGNAIAVCSMENVDPVGVHTGDSIVVAPALTLSDREYEMLRSASLDIVAALGIVGGCNCQYALNPDSMEYAVIEVNPRVSRSSALASKATGYPIAKVSTKIALGYTLDEIPNEVTGKTCACFEPAIDYIVCKFPKWPFDKFVYASRTLGTQMKATGEVMSIGANFESAVMKAVRGAEIGLDTLNAKGYDGKDVEAMLSNMDDLRLFTVFRAIKEGVSLDRIFEITRIDRFFLNKLKNLVDYEKEIAGKAIGEDTYLKGKRYGYTDKAIERISGHKVPVHRDPVYKMVDTCAAEFDAETPYFYATYDDENEALEHVDRNKKTILVLGSGPIRIGQGIEFDYSSVHCAWSIKKLGYDVAIVNNNPETVSTDFDVADRLYFEPLTPEDIDGILAVEKPVGVVVAFGGQTAIKLTKHLDGIGVRVMGTSADSIDAAEDRERFDALLEKVNFKRPKGFAVTSIQDAVSVANELGYPVLVRPSYVIGGQNMTIAYNDFDVEEYMNIILAQHIDNPVLIDKYLMGTELEVDVISDGKDVLLPGIMQHVERAGIHSGDSIAVYPPYNINDVMREKIVDCSTRLALLLGTRGLVNIQYVIYENELYVIEVNPRASRTIPYISKVTGIPMVDIATRIMLGENLADMGYGTGLAKTIPYVTAKVPVFSFEKLSNVNSILGPEMKSTGEVLGIGKTLQEALFKGLVSAGFKLKSEKENRGVYISVRDVDKYDAVKLAKKFMDVGVTIYATKGTADAIKGLGNDYVLVRDDDIYKYLEDGKIDFIVNTCPNTRSYIDAHTKLRTRALQLGIACMTSLDTANALADILASRFTERNTELVNLNKMRKEKLKINFVKMQSLGNDGVYLNNFNGEIVCPESMAILFSDRNFGIGSNGLAVIGKSDVADAKMEIYNKDGSDGRTSGTSLICSGKFLYDNGIVPKTTMTIETLSGIRQLTLFLSDGKVSGTSADMGKPILAPKDIPCSLEGDTVIDRAVRLRGKEYRVTCLSLGNPHMVTFVDRVDDVDLTKTGTAFEYAPFFPDRVNAEFVRVVNPNTLKLRVWERANGEVLASGTGACAAVVAAVLNGYCERGADVTVKTRGGDVVVNYDGEKVVMTSSANLVFEGVIRL